MAGVRRAGTQPDEEIWALWTLACRGRLNALLEEHLPALYVYLGGECGWSPSELDKHPLMDVVRWANERSRANERMSK